MMQESLQSTQGGSPENENQQSDVGYPLPTPLISSANPIISLANPTSQDEEYPFDAQEMIAIYQKRFGTPPPPKAIESMTHWNLTNAERAQVLYDINQLVRLLMDQLKRSDTDALKPSDSRQEARDPC